ncbi:cytochrome c-type biogenesis protein [Micavibrio aeruginosavorus]|uniref:cytochrome c-type biogenesis protein n=1 Tax=Micavibrio aeruginosavorus TaxID=349221 RepID=UPI003F4ABFD6
MIRVFLALLLLSTPAWAMQDPREILADPVQESRAQDLFHDLRCVVCQNQSIAESDAAIARDMRKLVRDRIESGASDADIINELHRNYGDFVLMTPPVDPRTWILWGMPIIILGLGGFVAMRSLRRAANMDDPS